MSDSERYAAIIVVKHKSAFKIIIYDYLFEVEKKGMSEISERLTASLWTPNECHAAIPRGISAKAIPSAPYHGNFFVPFYVIPIYGIFIF